MPSFHALRGKVPPFAVDGERMAKHLILCDCLGSQTLEAAAIEKTCGVSCTKVYSALCTREAESAAKLLAAGEAVIACAQEGARFAELAAEVGVEAPQLVDLRDRAGWSDDRAPKGPKMAALVADALLARGPVKTFDIASEGTCLVIGAPDVALAAAEKLAGVLSVTALMPAVADLPLSREFQVVTGKITGASGSLGAFKVEIDQLALLEPGGRGGFGFTAPRDGGWTDCDILLDLSGGTPLFPAPHKRDGYFRADPGSLTAVSDAIFEASQAVGTFEKTIHLLFEEHLCAHSRASQNGCTRCLDACPTGAILPAGDHVAIDPSICAGCGACAALCPSGAISYDAPQTSETLRRIAAMADAYHRVGGEAPRLLVHDGYGAELIALAARFGRGLPADVVPIEVNALLNVGHSEILAALASGFAAVDIVLAPSSERDAIAFQIELAAAMGGAARIRALDCADPDALEAALYDQTPLEAPAERIVPMGGRRQVARLSAQALLPKADAPLPLPAGAPYGAVAVDTDKCTLCLSCVSLCPAGALLDNPDLPQLRFQEDACLQCGICRSACPETAIALVPQLDLSNEALGQRVLNEEEPFCCVECGKPFGVRSTVERILDKLAGKHPMFANTSAGRLIQMCDDCRISAQYHSSGNPLSGKERPTVRTTDDYFSKRRDH